MKTLRISFLCLLLMPATIFAQYSSNLYLPNTLDSNRQKLEQRVIQNVILKGLSQTLTEATEEDWQNAFASMEVLNYKTPLVQGRMQVALDNLLQRSTSFQKTTLESAHSLYPGKFERELLAIIRGTTDPAIFTAASVNLYKAGYKYGEMILQQLETSFKDSLDSFPQLKRLTTWIANEDASPASEIEQVLKSVLSKDFLRGNTILFSFQRKNRSYPGLTIVRAKDGSFVQADDGSIFSIPQLARAVSNFPYFIKMGNTPQGIFSMYGFGVSRSNAIGPTANIQMGMPFELKVSKFFHVKSGSGGKWSKEKYAQLLPKEIRNYEPLYETYYAGEMGRNEIIAHGTTINPEYYKNQPYYPLTPTDGCLSTKEIWDGKMIESDQMKLINAVLQGGGAGGFVVVLNIDDQSKPVSIDEILPYMELAR